MTFFVYYHDGMGSECKGIHECEDGKEALKFIEERMFIIPGAELSDYTVIEGKKREIEAKQINIKVDFV